MFVYRLSFHKVVDLYTICIARKYYTGVDPKHVVKKASDGLFLSDCAKGNHDLEKLINQFPLPSESRWRTIGSGGMETQIVRHRWRSTALRWVPLVLGWGSAAVGSAAV